MFAPTTDTAAPAAALPSTLSGNPEQLLTPADVVAIVPGVSERQIRGYIKRGLMQGSNPAYGVWLVKRKALDAWIDAGQPQRVPVERPAPERPARLDPQRDRMPRASRRRRSSTELDLSIPAR